MSGNSTSLYTTVSSGNGTTTSSNFTTLYPNAQGAIVPTTPYGNANVVSLLAAGSDGANTVGNISATGNITANYYSGNGSLLTGVVATGVGTLTSLSVTGNTQSGNLLTAGVVSATGNVTGAFLLGNGSQLTGITGTYGNANVVANLAALGSNPISTTGNISGGYFLGNGSQLTGLPATYGNANVVSLMAAFGSNTVSTTGNITGGYILGNGSQLTGLPATYGNADVSNFLNNFGSNSISTTGNVTAGNVYTADAVSATGNVTGNYILGNGSQLTGLPATYGNANVATYLASGTNTQDIITTGTVTGNLLTTAGSTGNIIGVNYMSANYYLGNGALLTGITSTYGNANVADFLPVYGGNISANNIITTGNINVGGSLNSDDITSSNITVYGDQVITGNLTVQGNTTTINSNVVTTNDKTITVANNQSTGANVNGAGIDAGNPAIATWYYADASQSWQSNIGITPISNAVLNLGTDSLRWNTVFANVANVSGNIIGNYFIGNGSQLTGLPDSYGNANVSNFLNNFGSNSISTTGNVTAGYFVGNGSQLINITGANVTGTVANATSASAADTAQYVTANAQANITSIGVLTSLSVTGTTQSGNVYTAGAVSATGNVTGSYIFGNGSQLTGLPATYGNANVTTLLAGFGSNNISTSGNVTAGYVLGNGSQLTGLPATYSNANVTTLLAGFGSNNISTTGNVSAGYFVGDGSLLINITGANVTGTVANATYATSAGSAATVTGNAQANITSVGILTSLSVSGNVQSGNLRTVGLVSATGNVTGNYFIGNGSQLTGIAAGSGGDSFNPFLLPGM